MVKQVARFQEVGARLELARELRQRQRGGGFEKKNVAAAADMSASAYTQWINGTTRSYDAEKMMKVAAFLGVRLEWLMFGEPPMEDGEVEKTAIALLQEAPKEVVTDTLKYMAYQLSKSIADDRERLGHYLKMIDKFIDRPRDPPERGGPS